MQQQQRLSAADAGAASTQVHACWFARKPLGRSRLTLTVVRLCCHCALSRRPDQRQDSVRAVVYHCTDQKRTCGRSPVQGRQQTRAGIDLIGRTNAGDLYSLLHDREPISLTNLHRMAFNSVQVSFPRSAKAWRGRAATFTQDRPDQAEQTELFVHL